MLGTENMQGLSCTDNDGCAKGCASTPKSAGKVDRLLGARLASDGCIKAHMPPSQRRVFEIIHADLGCVAEKGCRPGPCVGWSYTAC